MIPAFLKAYLSVWNGRDDQDIILELLSFVPIDSFSDAHATYFSRAEQAIVSSEESSAYTKVIDFYTSVLQQQMCRAAFAASQSSSAQRKEDVGAVIKTLEDLNAHVSTLSIALLVSLPQDVGQSLVSSILAFYELLSVSSQPEVVPILLPPIHLVYLMAQHASPTTLVRVCGIIGFCKRAFDQHPRPVKNWYPAKITDEFNWWLLDLSNLVWASKAFEIKSEKSVGFFCDAALRSELNDYLGSIDREYTVVSAFALSNNAWLASLSAMAWRAMEEREIEREGFDRNNIRYHQGPVSKTSLEVLKRQGGVSVDWSGSNGYKVFVLNWLADRGLDGLGTLLFATVSDLRAKA